MFLECGYACNAGLGGMALMTLADQAQTVAIFESDAGWNTAGGLELLPPEPRHQGSDVYGFADGHAKVKRRERAGELVWEPAILQPADADAP